MVKTSEKLLKKPEGITEVASKIKADKTLPIGFSDRNVTAGQFFPINDE